MLFILNRQEKVVGVLKNSGKNSVPFFNDLLTEDLATGSETFEFTTVSRNGIGQHLVVGNFIAFKKGKSYKLFQIMQTEEDHQDELYITVYAECAGLQLINSVFRGVKIVSASFERVMQTLLSDTSWNVGILPYGLATTYDLDIEQASVYSLLQTYAQQYGVELEFRVELNRGKISKKYIDGYYNRGKVTGKRFTYERDIEGIVRKTDATELYTALIGRGNNGISFKDVTVDGIDKPMGQDFVANQSAYEKYNNDGYHIVGIYECDTDDAKDLLRKTHKRLLEVSEPKVEYDISVLLLCELLGEKWNEVAIGDTISVFDNAFYPPIMVSARVSKLQTSMTDKNANKCTLANFIEVKSNITSEMRKIASQLQGYVDNRFPIGSSDIQDGAVGMDKINDIYTQTITTDILRAGKVETEKLIAKEAEITNAKIENLKAGFIEADKIITDTIVANKAELDILEAKVGQIDTLVSGNISSENIQTGGITGSNLNMETIFVKDANILDLSASKLTAGEINTSKVVISSADGGMRLVGSTQQFVDENNRIRIQLGKDANGDFDFYILAENGDILFNTRGITGNAIENGLIKENMVSDGAIGGKKINWSSFVTEFNKDSNTHKLNSSKVLLDGTNQTLDIHFNRLNSTVNDNVNKTESNTTQLNVHQGKINTLIQDTTITKDGQTLKLKDEYSKLEQTVSGLKSTVGEQQTTINQNTGKITAAESKVSTLEQTVNGFNSELSHIKTTIDEQEEAIGSVNSALSGKANSNDVYKKSETMTTSAINSAITQSADNIKLGISNTYETKTNVETKVSSTLSSAKSYADTKKEEAISSASADATSKINSAKSELNTAINKKANSTDVYTKSETYTKAQTDSAIKVAKDEINLGVSSTYETKTNVETKVNNAVNSIQVGGRNLFLKSDIDKYGMGLWVQNGGTGSVEGTYIDGTRAIKVVGSTGIVYNSWIKLKRNTTYVYSMMMASTGELVVNSSNPLHMWLNTTESANHLEIIQSTSGTVPAYTWTKVYVVFKTPNTQDVYYMKPFIYGIGDNTVHITKVKIEEGTKATDWTPAPEDVQGLIDSKANSADVYNKSEVYTKAETNSQINVAKNEINLGVSKVEQTARLTSTAKMLYTDIDFRKGGNGVYIYNNSGNGTVTLSRVSKSSDCPTTSTHMMQITTNGSASPGHGGFYFANATRPNAVFITKFLAKIPVGYTLSWHSNAVGDGGGHEWLTSTSGTGKWEEYICKVNCGSSGAFSSTNFFALNGGSIPVTWYLGMATVYDLTDTSRIEERINSAESKITDSAIINTVQNTINTAKNEAINSANSSTDTKLNNYATKSSLTQTANNITAKFESSGGYNLLQNSGFKTGDISRWWIHQHNNPIGSYGILDSSATWGFPDSSVNCCQIRMTNQSEKEYGIAQTFSTTIGKKYTISLYYAGHRVSSANIIVRNSNGEWVANKSFNPSAGWGGNSNISDWGNISLTFTATQSSHMINLVLLSAENDGYFWIAKPQIVEGEVALPYSPHPSEIYNGSTVIDADGVTINNGAIRVKNKAGNTVLSGDSNGNLTLNGTIKSEISNGQYVALNSGGITFRDSQRSEEVLRLNTSFFESNRDMNGVTFAMPQYADFMRFSHIAKPSLENGWSSSDTTYKFMDFWSSEQKIGSTTYEKGIHTFAPIYARQKIHFKNNSQYTSDIIPNLIWNSISDMLGICGDNGLFLGYRNGENYHSRLVLTEGAHPGTGDNIRSWGNWNCSGYTVHNGTFSGNHVNSYANTYTRTSAQTHCIEAEQKQVRVNFEDVQITEGKAILNLPRKYTGIHNGYIVSSIVKKGRGDVWVSEESENRFILEGTDDIKVNVEVVIKLEEASAYITRTADDSQLCFDMSTNQPIV